MGEATPAQPTVGGFVPMLGVGMVGSMPGGVNGPIATSRGSAVPQLHSAIVERLRARIELCRRHHSTCENRYQRGQAENSDREHESTLHLLNIVQQGPGNRKTKGSRGSNQQPPEYGRASGEQKGQSSEGDQKISTRIALQGSLRRKIEGHTPGYSNKQNGLACGLSGPDFKRVRMVSGSLAHDPCAFNPAQSHQGASAAMGNHHHDNNHHGNNRHGLPRKNYAVPHGVGSDLFHMTLKEMKKEPVDSVQSCGQSSSSAEMMAFDEGGGQIDPDLQDLFDELTKTVPSLNDLELEKMLKQDDAFGVDLVGRPSSAGAGAVSTNLCSQLEKTIKTEYSPDYGQVHCGSPQLRPASAGPSFTIGAGAASHAAPGQKTNGQGGHPRGMPGWPEVSHAEQLKQMAAANQQQPNAGLHHHHHHHHHQLQQAPGGMTSWAPAMSTHSSGSSFPQDKLSNSATLGQQRLSPQRRGSLLGPILTNSSQSKGINVATTPTTNNNNSNCLFKPSNGHGDSAHSEMKVLGSKPMLHFTPKTGHTVNQPVMTGQLNKSPAQQQQTVAGPNSSHPGLPYQNQPLSGLPCLQPKPMTQRTALNQHGPSLHFKLAQQRQGMLPGPHLPVNSSAVGMPREAQPQLRASMPSNQQKNTGKTQAMQRQLNQSQHAISDSEKDSAQDQFNRHLTRPPPDYKQTRNIVEVQQRSMFQGMTPAQSLPTSGPDVDLQPMTCHLPNGPGTKMAPPTSDRRLGPDSHPGSCIGQLQLPQHGSNQNRLGIDRNKPRFPGKPGNQGNTFGVNGNVQPHPRTAAGQQSTGGVGGGMGNVMSTVLGWGSSSGSKPANAVGPGGLGIRRMLNPIQPQGGQLDIIRHPYQQQRSVGLPNHVAPDVRMHLLPTSTLRGSSPRSSQPMMAPLPSVGGTLNMSPLEQRVPPGAGSFPTTAPSPNPGSYQNHRASRLTFDFLQEGDNTVPGINTDSDFIDSLLKSGSGNDDWMKDINLDEILGGHS